MKRFTREVLRQFAIWLAIWGAALAAALIKYGVPPA